MLFTHVNSLYMLRVAYDMFFFQSIVLCTMYDTRTMEFVMVQWIALKGHAESLVCFSKSNTFHFCVHFPCEYFCTLIIYL